MTVIVRWATVDDAAGIARVIAATWDDQPAEPPRIASALRESGNVGTVAVVKGVVAGFADGFPTPTSDGAMVWNLDLIAVHPAHQGLGLATRLVDENTRVGVQHVTDGVRALVRVDNVPSLSVFEKCGYAVERELMRLYVASDGLAKNVSPPPETRFVAVNTFTYRGLWSEGELTSQSFVAARYQLQEHRYETAGAVINNLDAATITAAEQAGFEMVGEFYWCVLRS